MLTMSHQYYDDDAMYDDVSSMTSSAASASDYDDFALGAEANTFNENRDTSYSTERIMIMKEYDNSQVCTHVISSIGELMDAREYDVSKVLFNLGFDAYSIEDERKQILSRFTGPLCGTHEQQRRMSTKSTLSQSSSYSSMSTDYGERQERIQEMERTLDGYHKQEAKKVVKKRAVNRKKKFPSRQSSFDQLVTLPEEDDDVTQVPSTPLTPRLADFAINDDDESSKQPTGQMLSPMMKQRQLLQQHSFELEEVHSNDDDCAGDSPYKQPKYRQKLTTTTDMLTPTKCDSESETSSGFDEDDDVIKKHSDKVAVSSVVESLEVEGCCGTISSTTTQYVLATQDEEYKLLQKLSTKFATKHSGSKQPNDQSNQRNLATSAYHKSHECFVDSNSGVSKRRHATPCIERQYHAVEDDVKHSSDGQ